MKKLAKLYYKYLVRFLLGYQQEGQAVFSLIKQDFNNKPGPASLALLVYVFEFFSWLLHAVLVLVLFLIVGLVSKILDIYSPFKVEVNPKDEVL